MSRSTNVRSVMSSIDELNLEVDEIYLFKFGAVTAAKVQQPDDSDHPYTDRSAEYDFEAPVTDSRKFMSAIENHQNIFNFKASEDLIDPTVYESLGTYLFTGPVCSADVHLPKKQQKYQDMDCEEHFSVLISGIYFAAYAKVESLPPFSNMAHEFREIFRKQIIAKTGWQSPMLGPCPMHPNLIIVGTTKKEPSSIDFPLFYRGGREFFIVVEVERLKTLFEELFLACIESLAGFYEISLTRLELIHIDVEIQNRMISLVKAHNGFANTPFWKVRSVHRHLGIAREEWSARSFVPWSVSVAQLLLRSSSRRRGCGEVGSAFCFPLLHTLF